MCSADMILVNDLVWATVGTKDMWSCVGAISGDGQAVENETSKHLIGRANTATHRLGAFNAPNGIGAKQNKKWIKKKRTDMYKELQIMKGN